MAYEGAGIRFTDTGDGVRPQTPVQEAIQLLRLRIPRFAGAAQPPSPFLTGPGVSGAAGPGVSGAPAGMDPGASVPADLLKRLVAIIAALGQTSTGRTPAGGPGQAQSPVAALQAVLGGQNFGFTPSQGRAFPNPQFQYGQQPGTTGPVDPVPTARPAPTYAATPVLQQQSPFQVPTFDPEGLG